jgi:threonine/homoserine/homoserine lactone efflux protein
VSAIDNSQALFLLEVLGVLAVPGPTNSLLFVSGVTRGLRASLHLILAELGAYLLTISFLVLAVEPAARVHSTVGQLLRIVCSMYLAHMAVSLWRWEEEKIHASHPMTFRRVFLTTLVNPKSLVFAFLIFPRAGVDELFPYLVSFSAVCIGTASGWIAGGALLQSTGLHKTHLNWFYRGEAFLLASFALVILISAYYYS